MRIAKFLADWRTLELEPPLIALRLIARGFRTQRAAGFSYDGEGLMPPVFIALAISAVPEMFVLDLLFTHHPIVRVVSVVAHVYGVIWTLAIASAMQTQTHVVDLRTATFRLPLFGSTRIELNDVRSVEIVERRPPGTTKFGLGRKGVYITLGRPAIVERPFFSERSARLFVAVDKPHMLSAALKAGSH